MQTVSSEQTHSNAGKTLVFDRALKHPREKVWAALTDAKALSSWLMPNDLVATVGHKFTFRTKPAPGFDGVVQCEMLEVVPLQRLRFSWKGGGIDTVVTFDLSEADGETHLRLTQSGFVGVRARVVSLILARGWRKIMKRGLPNYLDSVNGE